MYNNYDIWTIDPLAVTTVESLFKDLYDQNVFVNKFDKKKADSIVSQTAWTVPQSETAIKLLTKYKKFINDCTILDKPIFKNKPINFDTYLNQNSIIMQEGVAVFYSKYDANLIQDIKDLRYLDNGKTVWPKWNASNKTWSILVTDNNVCSIVNVGQKYNLKIDSNLLEKYSEVETKIIDDKTLLILNDNQHITLSGNSIIIASTDLDLIEKIKYELGVENDG